MCEKSTLSRSAWRDLRPPIFRKVLASFFAMGARLSKKAKAQALTRAKNIKTIRELRALFPTRNACLDRRMRIVFFSALSQMVPDAFGPNSPPPTSYTLEDWAALCEFADVADITRRVPGILEIFKALDTLEAEYAK